MMDGADFPAILKWIKAVTPLTTAELEKLSGNTYAGVRLAYAAHIEPKMVPHIEFFLERGMEFLIAPCVPGVQSPESFDYLKTRGARVFGVQSANWEELGQAWEEMLKHTPTHLFDIGGGLIAKAVELGCAVQAATEATSTGIARIRNLPLPFPVYDWNDVPFKNLMHNRYEVGPGIWYAFRKVTGLDICRMKVGVVGFGLVGQGVAAIARGLGAQVFVTDLDPIRQLQATSEGFVVTEAAEMLSKVDILVTATGRQDTVTVEMLRNVRDGLILLNAGHDSREINVPAGSRIDRILPDIEEYKINGRRVYLLAEGRLLNLAGGSGSAINTFDLMTALIVAGLDFLCRARAQGQPGLQLLPIDVIADLQVRAASRHILS